MTNYSTLLALLSIAIVGCTTERPRTHEEAAPREEPDPHALFEQANTEFANKNYELAAETFSRCIDAANQTAVEIHFSVYGLRGLSNYKIGNPKQALEDTTMALKTIDREAEPKDAIARLYYQRAMIYLEVKDEPSASKDFESAIEYDPDRVLDPRTRSG